MDQITLDPVTSAKLHGLTAPVDFCDEQGLLLGRFVPYPAGIKATDFDPAISPEELRRRAEQFQGKPLSNLLAEWEKRK
jgi:hypothetical protein